MYVFVYISVWQVCAEATKQKVSCVNCGRKYETNTKKNRNEDGKKDEKRNQRETEQHNFSDPADDDDDET